MSCSHTGLAIGQSLRMCRQFSTGNPQLLHEQSVVKFLVFLFLSYPARKRMRVRLINGIPFLASFSCSKYCNR